MPSRRPLKVGGHVKYTPPTYTAEEAKATDPRVRRMRDHPVVVTSETPDAEGYVDFLYILSLTNRKRDEKFLDKELGRARYVPIDPCPPHPDNGTLLCLVRGNIRSRLDKPYVDTKRRRRIKYAFLRNFNRARAGRELLSLTGESYRTLLRYLERIDNTHWWIRNPRGGVVRQIVGSPLKLVLVVVAVIVALYGILHSPGARAGLGPNGQSVRQSAEQ